MLLETNKFKMEGLTAGEGFMPHHFMVEGGKARKCEKSKRGGKLTFTMNPLLQ
jgi:hypothetical protein